MYELQTRRPESTIYCSNMTINQENNNGVIICQHEVNMKFFWRCCISFVKFNYQFKFHVNTAVGSESYENFVNEGLIRNLEIGNSPIWVLPSIWRLWQVGNTNFGTNISNEKTLNAAKCQINSFNWFLIIKGKSIGWG